MSESEQMGTMGVELGHSRKYREEEYLFSL